MIAATVVGNLTKDCELKHTEAGALVVFSVAARRWAKDGEQTDFVDCAFFGRRAEAVAGYLVKGAKVVARGALGLRKYKTRDGRDGAALELRAEDIELVGGGKERTPAVATGGSGGGRRRDAIAPAAPDPDIPFIAPCSDEGRP